jgi:hypothetical protein
MKIELYYTPLNIYTNKSIERQSSRGGLLHFKCSSVYMATIVINNKFLHIRKITEYDIQNTYYDKRIFLIEDVNSKQMVGSASVSFLNSTSTIAKVGYIDDIIIRRKYESAELREELINYVTDVCVSQDNCIKCICK